MVFLLIISAGQLVALSLEYQDNVFLREYVAENTLSISLEIIGVVAFGIGLGYLAYRISGRAGAPREMESIPASPSIFKKIMWINYVACASVIIYGLITLNGAIVAVGGVGEIVFAAMSELGAA